MSIELNDIYEHEKDLVYDNDTVLVDKLDFFGNDLFRYCSKGTNSYHLGWFEALRDEYLLGYIPKRRLSLFVCWMIPLVG